MSRSAAHFGHVCRSERIVVDFAATQSAHETPLVAFADIEGHCRVLRKSSAGIERSREKERQGNHLT